MHLLESISHDEDTRAVLIAPATETSSAIDSFFRFLDLAPSIRPVFDQLIYDSHGLHPSHYSIRRAIKHTKAQILWIHDEEDDMTPLRDALLVKDDHNENVHFEITKGYGHRSIYRQNKVVKQILEFL